MILQVLNISKSYRTQKAVNNISFSINKGEIIGFLGPNGAGKSTTMQIISGCIPPDEGEILIRNINLREDAINAKMNIGFLPESNPLYEEMYVAEYLEYVAGLYSLNHIRELTEDIIKKTGITPERHKKISQLSKGYKQRVGLAQALIHDPKLLILDEPTSGLDPNQMEEIHQLLLSLSKDKGILFSSHTLSEVATICTRILFIHQGEIKADLPVEEINDLELLFKELTKK
ncbi:ATP-binding cassette domain-containing protein [Bacteroidales bacterium OttesenSCG-928-M06]|nr:ATP-binding cassette domain-containing protein [Bacteroidales bacterium OttesenSCG-928-M06]